MDSFSIVGGPLAPIPWTVLSATGEEALSGLYAFTLALAAKREDVDAALSAAGTPILELGLLGQQALLRIGDVGIERYGIVAAAHAEGTVERGGEPHARIRVQVAPRAWLLTQRRVSRIFQGKYVHQIVSEVLCQAGVRHRWNLGNVYPKRLYCTQYDETDYEFVTRLLAEEGILFFFEHAREFAGGPPPALPAPEQTDWEKAADGLEKTAKGAAIAGKIINWEPLKFGATAAAVVADFAKPPPKDEEADDPITPGAGAAGPSGAGDVLVFVDQAAFYAEAPHGGGPHSILTVTLTDGGMLFSNPSWEINELRPSRRVRTDRVEVRDYDFRRPLLLLQARAGRQDVAGEGGVPLEAYAHHGEYEKPEVTAQLAQVELEQHRADALLSEGHGTCPRLSPGHVFHIENAAAAQLPHERYAIVRIWHESTESGFTVVPKDPDPEDMSVKLEALLQGCARAIHAVATAGTPPPEEELRRLIRQALAAPPAPERTYWTRFECVPSGVAYRPPRPVRAPRHVTELATVVGPEGQEIYTDRYGRIKVQLHWDREGQWKESSSCWVRVIQPWAGAGFGFQFIPRVGMEVLVAFIAGDPDRPVVLGSLYNATHATPEPLPQRLTRSGIRSQTSPGGGGFNEISFEDQKGVERVYLHAQKDLHEIVNDTHTLNVKNHQNITVSGNQQIAAGGDQRVAVGDKRTVTVAGNATEHVQGSRTTNVIRNCTDLVQGNAFTSVGGAAVCTVRADALTVVEGNHNLSVYGDCITHVGGQLPDTKSSAVAFVQGSAFLTATDRVQVKAEPVEGSAASSSIRLECGASSIEITPSGITLSAATIDLRASFRTRIVGAEQTLTLDDDGARLEANPIELRTPQHAELVLDGGAATLTGPDGASVRGRTVHLHSGQSTANQQQSQEQTETQTPNLKLIFSHLRQTNGGTRIANTRYRLVVDDLVYEDRTDGNGRMEKWVPESARVAYITLWANETYSELYPREGGPLHWLVRLVPELPDANNVRGARMRLRNLGYDPGTNLGEEEVDPPTAAAILEFQLDQELPATGTLEDDTKKKISEIYGS